MDLVMLCDPEAYTSSLDHLWHDLSRIDQFVRAQTIRWRLLIGSTKPEELWGMVHVTDAEVESYLSSRYAPADSLPHYLRSVLEPYWEHAEHIAASIRSKLQRPQSEEMRLVMLQALFCLSDFEKDILLVCLLPELDSRYRRLFGYLQDDASRTRPTVEMILQILQAETPAGRAAFDRDGSLRRHQLVAGLEEQTSEPLSMRSLRIDDRIAAYLLDSDAPDARLVGIVSETGRLSWEALIAGAEHIERLKSIAVACENTGDSQQAVLMFHGPYGAGKLHAAQAICTALRQPLLEVDTSAALRADIGWEFTVDLVYREARLRDAAIYWSGFELLFERGQLPHRVDYLAAAAERFEGLTFFAGNTGWDPAARFRDRHLIRLDFPTPSYAMRRELWRHYLPADEFFAAPAPDREALTEVLANAFQFTEGQVLDAISTARALAARRDPLQPRLTADNLHEACRRHSSRTLAAFATRIEPRTTLTFDDLILPDPNKRQLLELRGRIRNRSRVYTDLGFDLRLTLGRGLIALFTGSSGTGKTMAAELLASEQHVDLYKIDLSAVISKYVGETEKNLSHVFEEAEDANAILFFDEADALFGKRGEVKEAKDRWANIEVNYLLQRVEEYAGVVILASNLRQNIDEAFLRRIHVIVEFPSPNEEARLRIWLGMFPPGILPPAHADIQDVANRFRLAGGSIRNIVLDAAFRAIAEGSANDAKPPAITLRHLVLSTAREYQKLGKPITRDEFDGSYYSWIEKELLRG